MKHFELGTLAFLYYLYMLWYSQNSFANACLNLLFQSRFHIVKALISYCKMHFSYKIG